MSSQIQFPPPMQPQQSPKPHSGKPTAAGIFLLLAAIQAIGLGAGILLLGSSLEDFILENMSGTDITFDVGNFLAVCGAMMLIFGIFALLGALMAIQRKSWSLAVVGSVMGLFTIGIFLTGSIFSLIALILLAVSRDEFN